MRKRPWAFRASDDGKTWCDLPAAVRSGKVSASDKGKLVCVDFKCSNILRSADRGKSWQELHAFQMPNLSGGAQGLRAIERGRVAELP